MDTRPLYLLVISASLYRYYRLCVLSIKHPSKDSSRIIKRLFKSWQYILVFWPRRQSSPIRFTNFFSFFSFLRFILFLYVYLLFFFSFIMSFEHNDDGAGPRHGPRHIRNICRSEIMEWLPVKPVTPIAEALQMWKLNDETPLPTPQESSPPPVDVQTLADNLRSVRTDLARLLERSCWKIRPKTAFPTHDYSEQLSKGTVVEEIFILDRAVSGTVTFHLKRRGPTFAKQEVLQSSHCIFFHLLDHSY